MVQEPSSQPNPMPGSSLRVLLVLKGKLAQSESREATESLQLALGLLWGVLPVEPVQKDLPREKGVLSRRPRHLNWLPSLHEPSDAVILL